MTDSLVCRECGERPPYGRYRVCNRCRHAKRLVPCPECAGLKRPASELCSTCRRGKRGPDHGCWRGGRTLTDEGYVRVWMPEHPRAHNGRYVLEHILVMEQELGRFLARDETVHHKNGIRDDNRPENLELWSSNHPYGQRVVDLLAWAHQIIERYES